MRAYLAILRDSLREAMASRSLWVLLALITLVLLGMAPFGYRETSTVGLSQRAVRQWPVLIERLKDEGPAVAQTPATRIWSRLDDKTRKEIQEFALPEEGDVTAAMQFGPKLKRIGKGLDKVSRQPDLYDPPSWVDTPLVSAKARSLKNDFDTLTDDEKLRFNRLLFESAFPDLMRASPQTSMVLRYAIWDLFSPIPIQSGRFVGQLARFVNLVMEWLVGGIGIFVAILFTAPMVPQTFEPGSINLLLSKPISRWMLLLTKYAGGCAFILINAAYLILGIFLILGVRFGMWNSRLLWTIPLYVFVFAVYYAVSTLAGAIWRSTVIAIVATILFWCLCFGVGVLKGRLDEWYFSRERLVKVISAGDTLLAVNEMGLTKRWNNEKQTWDDAYQTDDIKKMGPALNFMPLEALPRPIGPIYDDAEDRLLTIQRSMQNFRSKIAVGSRQDDWDAQLGCDAPAGAFAMFTEPDGTILVASHLDLFRLTGNPLESPESMKVMGYEIPLTGRRMFETVSPKPAISMSPPAAAALDASTGRLAIYSRGTVTLLERSNDGEYNALTDLELKPQKKSAAALAFAGGRLLIARHDGQLWVLDGKSLETQLTTKTGYNSPPRAVATALDGSRFLIVLRDRTLLQLDPLTQEVSSPPIAGRKDASAIAFDTKGHLLVAHHTTSVSRYNVDSWRLVDSYQPKLALWERVCRYGVLPLYAVFPKPAELDKTIQYVLAEPDDDHGEGRSGARTQDVDPWTPVWSSLIFMIAVLIIGCFYIQRQEF